MLCRDSMSSVDGGSSQGQTLSNRPTGPWAQRQAMMQRSHSWGSEMAPSVDSEGRSTPITPLAPGDLVCKETQVLAVSYTFNIPVNKSTDEQAKQNICQS